AVTRRPNEGMIAECLSVVTSTADTLLAEVHRLRRAHRLIVSPDRCQLEEYWRIDPARTIRYRRVDEYREALRSVLRQTVAGPLRSSTAPRLRLSGCADPSSVMATAMHLRRAGTIAVQCDAFSIV